MSSERQLPSDIERKLQWQDFLKAATVQLTDDAAKLGIGISAKARKATEQSPRELFDASEREDKFKLTTRILLLLSQAEHDFLYEELPTTLQRKIFQYKLDPVSARRFELSEPENVHEADALFSFLNEGLRMVQSRQKISNPNLN